MFDGDELMAFLKLADYCTVNDYEAKLLTERTGRTLEQLAGDVEALIVTLAGSGSHIYAKGRRIEIPVAPAAALIDPTGCGDAYRAGLLFGLQRGLDWPTTGRIASLMGSLKIAHHGTQNHRFGREEFGRLYTQAFGHTFQA
jgi:adenosine kinase